MNPVKSVIFRGYFFLLAFLGFFISSSALEVFKYGGARPEYAAFTSDPYVGVLDYAVHLWGILCLGGFFFYLLRSRLKIPRYFFVLSVLFFSFIFCSVAWSLYPGVSLSNAVLLSFFLVFSFVHVQLVGRDKVVSDVSFVLLILLLVSLFLIAFVPHYGIAVGLHSGSWQGVFSHKNNLGIASLLGLVFFVSEYKGGVLKFLKIAIAIVLLLGSRSYTSIVIAVVVLCAYVFLFLISKRSFSDGFLFLLLYFLLFLTISAIFIPRLGLEFSFFGKGADFSSRSLIWGLVLDLFSERPWLGYGLASFQEFSRENPRVLYEVIGGIVGTTHNGYLDAIFSFGVFGFLLALVVIHLVFSANSSGPYRVLSFLFLIVMVMCNGFESRFFSFNQVFLVSCYLLAIGSWGPGIVGE